jgi:hypothetical protein
LVALIDHHTFSGIVGRRNRPKEFHRTLTQGADFFGRPPALDANDDRRTGRQCLFEFVLHLNQGLVVLGRDQKPGIRRFFQNALDEMRDQEGLAHAGRADNDIDGLPGHNGVPCDLFRRIHVVRCSPRSRNIAQHIVQRDLRRVVDRS